ncbi:MAG: riboflavin biosynthesis protein RibF [Paludibacter sp.]|jgi:riboflavin kinase/FMN adenylyltransferase|nr:riboflavin biosynthesis protein RibF [Paludibacter sp.]
MKEYYAASVGFFDGVHAGHRFLIEELKKEAAAKGLKTMLVTFAIHPRKVLHDTFQPQLLTSHEEKMALLKSTGVDRVKVLNFTTEMARLTAREFIFQVLATALKVRFLLVGHDHRFGHNREDGFPEYLIYGKEAGIEVLQASRYSIQNQDHISSSTIRRLIQSGSIEEANTLLGYAYQFSGYVVSGYQVGRKIGFPTANLRVEPQEKLIPGPGVYAVEVIWEQNSYKGMMNIGMRPTIDNTQQLSIEVHIFNFQEDIYHELLQVQFLYKIRDEKKFESLDQLILQLKEDKRLVMGHV